MSISNALSKVFPQVDSVRKWRPSLGHVYHLPNSQSQAPKPPRAQESKETTPLPEGLGKASSKLDEASLDRVVEESFMVHMRYGGEYIDENPITGRPGEFHLSSTGRKPVPPPQLGQQTGIGAMNGPTINTKIDDKKDGKDKAPKSATTPKVKRRKSKKGSAATTPAGTTPMGS